MKKKKIAIALFNLGGPGSLGEVKGFLFNLFFDKRIITLPTPFRWLLAKLISTLRNSKAQEIYKKLGGKSPIVSNTKKQSQKLQNFFGKGNQDYKVFYAMRHSEPSTEKLISDLKRFSPDEIVLLPLYPQFSSTTTLSSFEEFEKLQKEDKKLGDVKTRKICCYYDNKDFVKSQVKIIKDVFVKDKLDKKEVRILFSAHSLPCSIIESGDPYQWQIEKNTELIMKDKFFCGVDHVICYQSKVGLKKWLSPTTESEIKRAADDGLGVVVVPIAFVSEHSETLVELDMDYKELAKECSIKSYSRVKTQGDEDIFIESLGSMCLNLFNSKSKNMETTRKCPKKFCFCIKGSNG